MAVPSFFIRDDVDLNILKSDLLPTKTQEVINLGFSRRGNIFLDLQLTGASNTGARFLYEVFDDSNNNGALDGGDVLLGSLSYASQKSFLLTNVDGPGFIRISDSNNSIANGSYAIQTTAGFVNSTPSARFTRGVSYSLSIRDFDGNLHGYSGDIPDGVPSSYKFLGEADVNRDGLPEGIFTNKVSGRWASLVVDPITGLIDYTKNGQGGSTRVLGIYIDPLVAEGESNGGFLKSGEVAPQRFGPFDSQARFQNDLKIDNLSLKTSGDFDGDGFQELYWKVNDGTAYLRSIMHADGNIQYANYQSEAQVRDYLNVSGYGNVINQIIG